MPARSPQLVAAVVVVLMALVALPHSALAAEQPSSMIQPPLALPPQPDEPGPPTLASRIVRAPFILPHQGPLCYVQRVNARPSKPAGPPGPPGQVKASSNGPAIAFMSLREKIRRAQDQSQSLLELEQDGQQQQQQQQQQDAGGPPPPPGPPPGKGQMMMPQQQGAGGGAGGADPASPTGLIHHVAYFTELYDLISDPNDAKGSLKFPENLDFRRVSAHYFSCVDPRAKYGILGTLGGDISEFIIALRAYENLSRRLLYVEDVSALFQDYLRLMISRGRNFFYMHTDEQAVNALKMAAGVQDPMRPKNWRERNRIIELSILPQHVGCMHLRGMLSDPNGYGVRKELVEWMIQTILNIWFDYANPLRGNILYVVSRGPAAKGQGYGKIWSPDECPGIAPLIVPDNGQTKDVIHHVAHVEFFRQDLARFFGFKNAIIPVRNLYAEIRRIAQMQESKMAVYTSAPPVDVIFTNPWERWPF